MTPDSSLAQTLAPELLYKIFTECVPSILSPTVLSTAPLNVSLVCRSWQALALERPDLWATIRLSYADLDHWYDAYPGRHLSLYRLLSGMWRFWLDRSGVAPLDIVLEMHVNSGEGVLEETRLIYQALLETQHRWRSVTIEYMNMVDGSDGDFISDLTASPLLEKLSGSIFRTSRESLVTYAVGLDLSTSHRLKHLTMQNPVKVVPITCQMHRLRILKVKSINMDGLVAVLQCSSNIEVLAIAYGTYGRFPEPETSSIISLPALTDLDVGLFAVERDWTEWISLFKLLQCPSLINFRFISHYSRDMFLPLKDFFARSRPPLERFSIETTFDAPKDEDALHLNNIAFLVLLNLLPCLVFLEIQGRLATSPEFLESLAKNRPDGYGLCPLLTHTTTFMQARSSSGLG